MLSKYQRLNRNQLKRKAKKLYRAGLTLREVGKIMHYSHEWVRKAVNDKT